MKQRLVMASAVAGLTLISGCVSARRLESPPVRVTTDRGVVACQLHAHVTVLRDEAISAAAGMAIAEADQNCRGEEYRRLPDARG